MKQLESFILGILAAIGALCVELVLEFAHQIIWPSSNTQTLNSVIILPTFIIIAALVEEIFKYIMIAKRIDRFSLFRSYIVNSLIMGAGFAAFEIFLARAGMTSLSQVFSISDYLMLALLHIGTSGLLGYYAAIGNPAKISTMITAIGVTTLLHIAYNMLLVSTSPFAKDADMVIIGALIAMNIINLIRLPHRLAA